MIVSKKKKHNIVEQETEVKTEQIRYTSPIIHIRHYSMKTYQVCIIVCYVIIIVFYYEYCCYILHKNKKHIKKLS